MPVGIAVLFFFLLCSCGASREEGYIFVSTKGSDERGNGSKGKPYATVQKARDRIRELNANSDSDFTVYLRGGNYYLSEPVELNNGDSGGEGHTITIMSYPGEHAVLSGGVPLTNWEKIPGTEIWKAPVTIEVEDIRQFYFNGEWRPRASTNYEIVGLYEVSQKNGETGGFAVNGDLLPDFKITSDMEIHSICSWRKFVLPVDTIYDSGDKKIIKPDNEVYTRTLPGPHSDHLHKYTYIEPFYLENAYELMDIKGEWYYNRREKELFYLPMEGENPSTAETVIPVLSKVLEVKGTTNQPVRNIIFKGLTFAHATWNDITKEGYIVGQAQAIHLPLEGRVYNITPAMVQVSYARNVVFEDNIIRGSGAVGLSLYEGVKNCTIKGNYFTDTGDTGLTIGLPSHGDAEESKACSHNLVSNNLFYKLPRENWGVSTIECYFVNNIRIEHNYCYDLPAKGISVGWGWSDDYESSNLRDNEIFNNVVSDFRKRSYDGGAIYTLGKQSGTVIRGNYARNMMAPRRAPTGALYLDAGSRDIIMENNVVENVTRWLILWMPNIKGVTVRNNYSNTSRWVNESTNSNVEQAKIYLDSNWPEEAREIIDNAGLEQEYKHLMDNLSKKPEKENDPPKVWAQLAEMEAITGKPMRLRCDASDDGLPFGVLKYEWVVKEARRLAPPMGDVKFVNRFTNNTEVTFTSPGEYILQLQATDREKISATDIFVKVHENKYDENLKNVAYQKRVIVNKESGKPDQASGRLMTDGNIKTKYTPALIHGEPIIDLGSAYKVQGFELEVGMNRFLRIMDRNKRLMIQGSNSADFSDYITLAYLETGKLLFDQTWTLLPVTKEGSFRYIRLKSVRPVDIPIYEIRVFALE